MCDCPNWQPEGATAAITVQSVTDVFAWLINSLSLSMASEAAGLSPAARYTQIASKLHAAISVDWLLQTDTAARSRACSVNCGKDGTKYRAATAGDIECHSSVLAGRDGTGRAWNTSGRLESHNEPRRSSVSIDANDLSTNTNGMQMGRPTSRDPAAATPSLR